MRNTKAHTLTLSLSLFASSAFAAESARVLIIDQGADLSHSKLATYVNWNLAEKNGQAKMDDDQNGFVDDTAGWNAISNDNMYMPEYIQKFFTDHSADVTQLLDIYTRMENGDQMARDQFIADPELREAVSMLLDLSHGTHVAGITAQQSRTAARLQSLNLFTSSTANSPANDGPVLGRLIAPLKKPFIMRNIDTLMTRRDAPRFDNKKSFLDDRAEIDSMLNDLKTSLQDQYSLLTAFLKASQPQVVNLSLGVALADIKTKMEGMWQKECVSRGLPKTTLRNANQEANFKYMAESIYGGYDNRWVQLFSDNSNVLFVIAAGNDGDPQKPEQGNIETNPCTPATISGRLTNVITVAATNQQGLLADFSNYNSRLVNIGAWGTAVPSLAPAEHTVAMSGTSMAAPFISGVASKIAAINPLLKPNEIRALIERTGSKVGSLSGKTTSGAMVNPDAAFAAAQNTLLGIDLESAIDRAMKPFGRGIINPLGSLDTSDGTEGLLHNTSALLRSFISDR